MTYYGGKELAGSFRIVRGNTIQIAEDIAESSYGFQAASSSRTIGQTLVHIAVFYRLQAHIIENGITDLTKVNFPALIGAITSEEDTPRSKSEILALLKSEGEVFASYLEALPESKLAEIVAMFPGATPSSKSRLEMLMTVKEHEMHHRGQLMLLQRILGLTPHLTRQMQERMAAAAAPKA
jgi:uncharacterized damage-inducible protein DinB